MDPRERAPWPATFGDLAVEAGMWLGVLGPLEVRDGKTVRSVPAAKQRVLLGALLVHPGHVMSANALAEIAWDGAPPAGVRATVRSYISRLRQTLGHSVGDRIVT